MCVCKRGFKEGEGGICRPVCGDGEVSGRETCDDGNAISDDGCSEEVQTPSPPARALHVPPVMLGASLTRYARRMQCSIEDGFECPAGLPCSCLLGKAGCCQRAYSSCIASISNPPPVRCCPHLAGAIERV